mmetsp:Transcript_14932/g.33325  ORF Transcript_14932/g.33325 Transcript_14932/m.33325 type:complete len:426 (+) Transcript_14932:117-1394(+)
MFNLARLSLSFKKPTLDHRSCILFAGMPPRYLLHICLIDFTVAVRTSIVTEISLPSEFHLDEDESFGILTVITAFLGSESVERNSSAGRSSVGAFNNAGAGSTCSADAAAAVSGGEEATAETLSATSSLAFFAGGEVSSVGLGCFPPDEGASKGGRDACGKGAGGASGTCAVIPRATSLDIFGWSFIRSARPSRSCSEPPIRPPRSLANSEMLRAIASPPTMLDSFCLLRNFFRSSAHFGSSSWMRMCSERSPTGTDFPLMGSTTSCPASASSMVPAARTTFGRYEGTTWISSVSSSLAVVMCSSLECGILASSPPPTCSFLLAFLSPTSSVRRSGRGGAVSTISFLSKETVSTTTKSCQSIPTTFGEPSNVLPLPTPPLFATSSSERYRANSARYAARVRAASCASSPSSKSTGTTSSSSVEDT